MLISFNHQYYTVGIIISPFVEVRNKNINEFSKIQNMNTGSLTLDPVLLKTPCTTSYNKSLILMNKISLLYPSSLSRCSPASYIHNPLNYVRDESVPLYLFTLHVPIHVPIKTRSWSVHVRHF